MSASEVQVSTGWDWHSLSINLTASGLDKSPHTFMRLSLLVATFGRDEELHALLRSLQAQTFQDFEVIVIDQNPDERVTDVLACYAGDFPILHQRSAKGHSHAFNVGLKSVTGDAVAFPDDDCWYDPDLLEHVVRFFEGHPEQDGVTGREQIEPGFSSGFRWDPCAGPITPSNVWRRAITFSIFLRRPLVEDLRFDESLGVGSGSPWGAGEETDYLLRAIAQGHSIHYDPALTVWHRGRSGPYTPEVYAKARYYGRGIGRVLRKHRAPAHSLAPHLVRPLGGAFLFLGAGDVRRARYHWSIFCGRCAGWMARLELPPCGSEARATGAQPASKSGLSPGRYHVKNLAARLLRNDLVHNAAALYGVQISRKLIPLLIVPYLARTLGPAGWGMMAFSQSLGEFVVLLIEFGFNLSATRVIARHRESKSKCSEVIAGVLGAQMLLAMGGVSAAIFVSRFIPLLRDHPKLLAAALFYAVAQGLLPLWFFQGLEKLRLAAGLEIAGKLLAMGAILWFVRTPQDGWVALFIQGLAPALSTVCGLAMTFRVIPFQRPTFPLVREAIRLGWQMFVFRSGESLYGVGNAFVLGLFAPAVLVGYFASAEKISRAMFGLLNPIREALYPRISHIVADSPEQAAELTRIGAVLSISGGVVLCAMLFVFGPFWINLLMGPGFAPAVSVLRILSVLPLLLAVSHSVGLQWLLPRGRDAEVNRIILSAGALNLALAIVFAPFFAHVGMAWAVVCAEALVCYRMVRLVARSSVHAQNSLVAATLSSN